MKYIEEDAIEWPLSFRDQAALMAMQGILASDTNNQISQVSIVTWSWEMADAMENERKNRGSK